VADYLFSMKEGVVSRIQVDDGSIALPGLIQFGGSSRASNYYYVREQFTDVVPAIIIAKSSSMRVVHQVSPSLGRDVFLTTFSISPQAIVVQALIFEYGCFEGEEPRATGYAGLMAWWNARNAHATDAPITLTVGNAPPIDAYLVELRSSISLGQGVNDHIWAVELHLLGVPDDSYNPAGTTGTFGDVPGQIVIESPSIIPTPSGAGTAVAFQSPASSINRASNAGIVQNLNANGDVVSEVSLQVSGDGYLPLDASTRTYLSD
jgi:hypothetical protein